MTGRQLAKVTRVTPVLTRARSAAAPEAEINPGYRTPLPGHATAGTDTPHLAARAAAPRQATSGRFARVGRLLLQLQRYHGNRYVQRAVEQAGQTAVAAPVPQAKLMLGAAGDRYEREADRVAQEVVRPGVATAPGRGAAAHAPAAARPAGAQARAVNPAVQHGIQRARTGGQAISQYVRALMEDALGADFRAVRLHTDDAADWLNRALRSRAFTTGQDIFFRRGEYQPGSSSARKLLAHELTHVMQQNPSAARSGATDGAHVPSGQGALGVQGSMIQCMFPAAPHAGDLDEINRIDNKPHGTLHKHQGVTSQPQNYVAPLYNIEVTKKGRKDFTAEVKAHGGGYIGDCEATYLGKGAYDTGYLWAIDPLYVGSAAKNRLLAPHVGLGNPPAFEHVIENVSASVARGSKAAEQEHLNDYRYAYGLTLGAAEAAIETVENTPFEGATGKKARAAADTTLRQELRTRSHQNLDTLDRTAWEAKYAELFRRSGTVRDGQDYHLQDFAEDNYWNTGVANKLSRKKWGFPVHHLKVVPGPLFQLGIPSRTVIDPNANLPG
jgi:hypothetical protein